MEPFLDDEALIAAVKKRPELYDQNNFYHKDRYMVKSSWRALAQELEAEELELRMRWKNLRDYFSRLVKLESRTGGSVQKGKKKWHLYDKMLFIVGCRKSSSKSVDDGGSDVGHSSLEPGVKVERGEGQEEQEDEYEDDGDGEDEEEGEELGNSWFQVQPECKFESLEAPFDPLSSSVNNVTPELNRKEISSVDGHSGPGGGEAMPSVDLASSSGTTSRRPVNDRLQVARRRRAQKTKLRRKCHASRVWDEVDMDFGCTSEKQDEEEQKSDNSRLEPLIKINKSLDSSDPPGYNVASDTPAIGYTRKGMSNVVGTSGNITTRIADIVSSEQEAPRRRREQKTRHVQESNLQSQNEFRPGPRLLQRSNALRIEDPDELFLGSLLPHMKLLSPAEKMNFQIEMLTKLLKYVECSGQSNGHSTDN